MVRLELKTQRIAKKFILGFDVPLTKIGCHLAFYWFDRPETFTTGIGSRCKDGRHVLFIDYDKLTLDMVEEEIKFLQEAYDLGNAYIFEMPDWENSFHVIFLDKLSLHEAHQILQETNCDATFINSVKFARGREWVLRVTGKGQREKPKYLKTLPATHDMMPMNGISTAHKLFLQTHYNVPFPDPPENEDGITELPIIIYNTASKVVHKNA